MDLYLTESKLTSKEAFEAGLLQAVTSSIRGAQQLAYDLMRQYASTIDVQGGVLRAELRALSGDLPPSDRHILAMDAFAQARSFQGHSTGDGAHGLTFVCTGVSSPRSSLRKTVQAAVLASVKHASHEDRHTYTSSLWRDVSYAAAGTGSDGSLEQLLQLLTNDRAAHPNPHNYTDDDTQTAVEDRHVAVTPLAAAFTDAFAAQPTAAPLDTLINAYSVLISQSVVAPNVDNSAGRRSEHGHAALGDFGVSPSMLLLRPAKITTTPSQPPLVISHSLLGDHRGSGRLWTQARHSSSVSALVHRGLSGDNTFALDHEGCMSIASEYAMALCSGFAGEPFDLIGASFGAVLASHVAASTRAGGGFCRRLVLVDPPPAVPGRLPVPKMLTSLRIAAMGVLLIHLHTEMGASVWEQFPQLKTLPEVALPCFVAAQCLPPDSPKVNLASWSEQFHRLLLVYRQCRYAFHTLSANIEAHADCGGSPAVLMCLSIERWPTFREMFPGILEDVVDNYGPCATLQLHGKHLAMVDRCLGNDDASFTYAMETFLSGNFNEAWWWVGHAPLAHRRMGQPHLPAHGTPGVMNMHALPALLATLSSSYADSPASEAPQVCTIEVESVVQQVARELLGSESTSDAPLMEAGLDSLGAVEFRSRLSASFDGIKVPETLIFDFPTLRQVTMHMQDLTAGAPTDLGTDGSPAGRRELRRLLSSLAPTSVLCTPPSPGPAGSNTHVWLHAACCTLGGGAHGSASAWGVVAAARNAVGAVPHLRWETLDRLPRSVMYGAFLQSIELFDHASFGLAPAEAELMDPHQRLALESGYSALHGAHLGRDALMSSNTSVFAGIWESDYSAVLAQMGAASRGPFAMNATGCSMLVGRLSYTLGLHGPSIPFDTACSSTLSASHVALCALQRRETDAALVLGVNVMCASKVSQTFAAAHMTSPTGKSHTFDARADGYARGEACCSAVLQREFRRPASSCVQYAASAVQQDGRSATLTAPNGTAQRAMLHAVLERAGRTSAGAFCLESHGTGTSLGDPIEARAASAVRDHPQLMAIAGCKANFGHTEPAAGLTGMLQLSFAVRLNVVAPNAQLRALNPHVNSAMVEHRPSALLCQFGHALAAQGRIGGVSSFGLNGTIAHAVVYSGEKSAAQATALAARLYRRHAFAWRKPLARPSILDGLPDATDGASAILALPAKTQEGRANGNLVDIAFEASSKVAVIELNDALHFNALSDMIVMDLTQAVERLCLNESVCGVVLQAAGPHFCIGGNPHVEDATTTLASFSDAVLVMAHGCCQLRKLRGQVVALDHGHLVGGGVALSLNADYAVSDWQATFEHGNLPRGAPTCILQDAL